MLALHRRDLDRRGVVLVLVLAMLGLLAVIGVTFATLSGQAQVGARSFSQSIADPDCDSLMNYALDQLINDTNNFTSAIRGHSLKRDMYGMNGFHNSLVDKIPSTGDPLTVTGVSGTGPTYTLATNIPSFSNGPIDQVNFARWVLKLELWAVDNNLGAPGASAPRKVASYTDVNNHLQSAVAQTFQVTSDDASGSFHALTVSPTDATTQVRNPVFNPTTGRFDPAFAGGGPGLVQPNMLTSSYPYPPAPPSNYEHYELHFTLDSRWRGAFLDAGQGPYWGMFANYRYNGATQYGRFDYLGPGWPEFDSLGEDYDAPDLDNWFLALQSADGQVMIPSFHRPGILQVDYSVTPPFDDWRNTPQNSGAFASPWCMSMSKILRPRAVDHPLSGNSFPDLKPDANGVITYDVDNDGDGVNDSVWLDLGYPVHRDATGKMFKPLFSFMVLGLNGRMPLNSAGNLQSITVAGGGQNFRHTSHLGVSPSEVNPTYALQNAPNGGQVATNALGLTSFASPNPNLDAYGIDVSVTQLRNILAGTRPQINPLVPPDQAPNNGSNGDTNWIFSGGSATTSYTTMWMPDGMYQSQDGFGGGSVAWTSPAVAGRWGEVGGMPTGPATNATGYRPNDWNNPIRAGYSLHQQDHQGNRQAVDSRDDNNTALDHYPTPAGGNSPELADHFDASGSIRLPSERIRRFVTPIDVAGTGQLQGYNYTPTGLQDYGRGPDPFGRVSFFHYFRPPGVPIDYSLPFTGTHGPAVPTIPDTFNNAYHGYEALRVPASGTNSTQVAAMPFNRNLTGTLPSPPSQTPTFDNYVNSQEPFSGHSGTVNNLAGGSLGLNEADEMPLYESSPHHDAPYGPHDLEWLFREHDVDGATLDSRLARLAPVSFTNTTDGGMRRRMFSIETWDIDRFPEYRDGGLDPLSARAGRRINLNFPFPVSTDPSEPIRQKWIRETYQLLKQVLPSGATNTPEKLAQLSQFVVNIVDFRDPDGAMTRFVNTDIAYTPAAPATTHGTTTTPASQATLSFSGGPPAGSMPFDPGLPDFNPTGTTYLVQYGMEYTPVAINEVLAYQFQFKDTSQTPPAPKLNQRLWIELVNTLTQDGNASTTALAGLASDAFANPAAAAGATPPGGVDLSNWDLVLTDDSATGRPDPFTGQVPPTTANPTPHNVWRLNLTGAIPALVATGDTRPNSYYVIGNASTNAASEPNALNAVTTLPSGSPLVPPALAMGSGTSQYYWLHLRRPANPKLDYTNPNQRMVVVDSFRFPYTDSGVNGSTDAKGNDKAAPATSGAPDLYSLQRLQPYRGGQALAALPVGKTVTLDTHYGYSEQTSPPPTPAPGTAFASNASDPPAGSAGPGWYGHYGSAISTKVINNTLGARNSPNDYVTGWDYVPFHDRDFQSLAELLLVPGVPPGLFTKQFVEVAPDLSQVPPFPASLPFTTPPPTKPATVAAATAQYNTKVSNAGTPFPMGTSSSLTVPKAGTFPGQTYPYLVDRFYYSTDGWYQMLEYLEVPPPTLGATGDVASGANYDWSREDRRPGLLNLNLIIDEEVFFGLIDDPRLLRKSIPAPPVGHYPGTPQVVTQIDANGMPSYDRAQWQANGTYAATGSYFLNPTRGYYDSDTSAGNMKVAFADFLRQRHGGSNFLFAWGQGGFQAGNPPYNVQNGWPTTQPPPVSTSPVTSAEQPFRALAGHDITATVMRPGVLHPTKPYNTSVSTNYVMPGQRDTTYGLDATGRPLIPQTPPRRLFQVPDQWELSAANPGPSGYTPTGSNAAIHPTGLIDNASNSTTLTAAPIPSTIAGTNAPFPMSNATSLPNGAVAGNFDLFDHGTGPFGDARFGAKSKAGTGGASVSFDGRQHPAFRIETLSKVMNLTTTRTHQYAVWVTVGFFEVVRQGNLEWVMWDPLLAADQLGQELGASNGSNVRFRAFFLIDRSRAVSFDPGYPGDFRDLVTYRRRIE